MVLSYLDPVSALWMIGCSKTMSQRYRSLWRAAFHKMQVNYFPSGDPATIFQRGGQIVVHDCTGPGIFSWLLTPVFENGPLRANLITVLGIDLRDPAEDLGARRAAGCFLFMIIWAFSFAKKVPSHAELDIWTDIRQPHWGALCQTTFVDSIYKAGLGKQPESQRALKCMPVEGAETVKSTYNTIQALKTVRVDFATISHWQQMEHLDFCIGQLVRAGMNMGPNFPANHYCIDYNQEERDSLLTKPSKFPLQELLRCSLTEGPFELYDLLKIDQHSLC